MSTHSKHQTTLLLILFFAALAFRLFSVYPPPLRYDPATVALQACQILDDGERPIFWAGQAFMGTAGAYCEAFLFSIFGKNTLVLSLFAWALSSLWIFLSLLLALRFFGMTAALFTALFWTFPTYTLMYWSCQARPDYQICFILAPLIFLLTHEIVHRFCRNQPLEAWVWILGFVCGFGFWNNMALGPCLVVSFAVLLWHLRGNWMKKQVWIYSAGWFLGFAPVLWHNWNTGFEILHQANFKNVAKLSTVFRHFITHAFPDFWGMAVRDLPLCAWKIAQLFFLAWVVFLYVVYAVQVFRRWKNKEDLLPDQLVFGFLIFHLFIASVSNFGTRFAKPSNPILYITCLYGIAFAIPASVLSRMKSCVWRGIFLLPFLIYFGNNLKNTVQIPVECLQSLKNSGASAILHFPNPENRLIAFLKEKQLDTGYVESRMNKFLALEGWGLMTLSNSYAEHHLKYALTVDGAKNIFWIPHGRDLTEALNALNCRFEQKTVNGFPVYHHFQKEEISESLIEAIRISASENSLCVPFLADRHADTFWKAAFPIAEEAWICLEFEKAEKLHKLVLLPEKDGSLPSRLKIQGSADGNHWDEILDLKSAGCYFWSVYHPFVKLAKPRAEFEFHLEKPLRFLRLLAPKQEEIFSVREVYAYRSENRAPILQTLDAEMEEILKEAEPLKPTHQIVGDHWFMNFFKRRGFDVEFISNGSVNNNGQENPGILAPLPLRFEKPLLFIVEKSHSGTLEARLKINGIPFGVKTMPRWDLFFTEPAKPKTPLYWSGFDLLDVLPKKKGRRLACFYPPLAQLHPDAERLELVFGEEFSLTGSRLVFDPKNQALTFQMEITPKKELKKDYYVFLHFCEVQGKVKFQGDFKMENSFGPTSRWASDERVLLERTVKVPEGIHETVIPRFGIWEPESGKRLKVNGDKSKREAELKAVNLFP